MFRKLIKTTVIIGFVISSLVVCSCQQLQETLKYEMLEDDFEYLDEYEGEVDDFTINRDTKCNQFCYSSKDKCCGYSSPLWGSLCRSGKAQSPINLPGCKVKSGVPIPPVDIDGDLYKGKFSLTNDGHAVVLQFLEKKSVNISGAGSYILDNIRFHWGRNDTIGSEHCIKRVSGDGCVREAMELQLIHYKADKEDLESAIASGQKHAVLVISLLLRTTSGKSSADDDDASTPLLPVLNPVLKHLEEVATFGDTVIVKQTFDLTSWFSVPNVASSYFGSITIPKCKQVVRWFVLQTPMTIKAQDVPPFRNIKQADGESLLENRRSMQKRNKRNIQCFQLNIKNIPLNHAEDQQSMTLQSNHAEDQQSMTLQSNHAEDQQSMTLQSNQ